MCECVCLGVVDAPRLCRLIAVVILAASSINSGWRTSRVYDAPNRRACIVVVVSIAIDRCFVFVEIECCRGCVKLAVDGGGYVHHHKQRQSVFWAVQVLIIIMWPKTLHRIYAIIAFAAERPTDGCCRCTADYHKSFMRPNCADHASVLTFRHAAWIGDTYYTMHKTKSDVIWELIAEQS